MVNMTNRLFYIDDNPQMRQITDRVGPSSLIDRMRNTCAKPMTTKWEIREGDIVPAITLAKSGRAAVFPMVFGFTPVRERASRVIYTTVENASEKEEWRETWESRRCLIPFSYYYEWKQGTDGKTEMLVQPEGVEMAYMAALYRMEEKRDLRYPAFSILTKPASEDVSYMNQRMPVIFEDHVEWVMTQGDPKPLLRKAMERMAVDIAPPEKPITYDFE